MSTITVTNIKATGETASRAVSGVAAAWCNWNGTGTIAINDSENISSIADGGTGVTTVTYTNGMVNGNYANGGAARQSSGGGFAIMRLSIDHNAGSTRWVCEQDAGTDIDGEMQTVTTHGDLA